MTIVLASGSPRRKELLEMLGFKDMLIIPARGEETAPEDAAPDVIVKTLSAAKAKEVAAQRDREDIIIAADTIVWSNGRMLGKPRDEQEAFRMLSELSGKTHEVYTGVSVIKGDAAISEYEKTYVTFRKISDDEIKAYIKTGEPMDKAGAYGIQGKASIFVERIEGDYFNVVGLPLCRLNEILKKQGAAIF